MSEKTFTFTELERQHGLLFPDSEKYPLDKKMTVAEFRELIANNPLDFAGVNFEDREKFLRENDYEVTRENMIDRELSAKS